MILRFAVLSEQVRQKKCDVEALAEAIMLTQEYVIKYMLLPGQVENWCVIADMGNQGFSSTPVHELKGLINILADHYSCRMAKAWVFNVSFGAAVLWKIIRTFLDPETLAKVELTRASTCDSIKAAFQPE